MVKVIGVRFRHAGKIYYFSPGKLKVKTGDYVIVETARGLEYGYVVIGNKEVDDSKVIQPLKPVMRMATEQDTRQAEENKIGRSTRLNSGHADGNGAGYQTGRGE